MSDAVPPAPREDEREVSEEQLSLGRRLRQPRTILSLVLPIVLLVLIFRVALNVDVNELATGVQRANPALLVAAFVVFYLGFPLRGFRWSLLGTPPARGVLVVAVVIAVAALAVGLAYFTRAQRTLADDV